MADDLNGIRIAILSTDGFEEPELIKPKEALEEAGAEVLVFSPSGKDIYGMHHHDKAGTIPVDGKISEQDPDDFDAVVLPGGALNADALRVDEDAQEFVSTIDDSGKPLAVICHGAWLLVSADLVDGRKITSWPSIRDDIQNAGGEWENSEVVVDENWVSSRKPDDIPAFNKAFIKLLQSEAKKAA